MKRENVVIGRMDNNEKDRDIYKYMSDYKNFLLRQLGIKESAIKPTEDETDATGPSLGINKQSQEPSSRDRMISPTAVSTPVIAMAVRGSVTGGLPSGKNMSSSKLGGYEPIPTTKQNSEVVDKTPNNVKINSSSPISDVTSDSEKEVHPHQVQNADGEPPQSVTGASIEDDGALKLKDMAPKQLDIDVTEGEAEDNHADNPDFQQKDGEQFRKDRASSPEGDEVRNQLGIKEQVSVETLLKIRQSLQEKAISGKMNAKESEAFKRITEVLQKRGLGLEEKLFGKKSMLETANVKSDKDKLDKKLADLKKRKDDEASRRQDKEMQAKMDKEERREDLA